jgi:hypothetical protein
MIISLLSFLFSFILETLFNQTNLGKNLEFYIIGVFIIFITTSIYSGLFYVFIFSIVQDIITNNFLGSSSFVYFSTILLIRMLGLPHDTQLKRLLNFIIFITSCLFVKKLLNSFLDHHFDITINYWIVIINTIFFIISFLIFNQLKKLWITPKI